MPILDDIMDHDLYGPAIRQGREIAGLTAFSCAGARQRPGPL
jgi:hypothetical protein